MNETGSTSEVQRRAPGDMPTSHVDPGMTVAILFAPRFVEWPLALIRNLREAGADLAFCGLSTGHIDIHRRVSSDPVGKGACLDELDELERGWLQTPVSDEIRKDVLSVFSHEDLNRILISDRNVGWGYVTGADFPLTPLMKLCARPDILERYIFNLCKWVIAFQQKTRFNSCLCYAIAGAPGFALELFCARKGIPFVKFYPSRIGDITLLMDSSVDPDERISARYSRFRLSLDDKDDDIAFARRYLEAYLNKPQQPGYSVRNNARYLAGIARKKVLRQAALRLYAYLRSTARVEGMSIRKVSVWRRVQHDLKVAARARRLAARWPYDRVADLQGRPFVYYPLQVNPEASTMVLAPMFTDQLAMIEALSKAIPVDMALVVKEHVPMLGRRPPGFYEALRKIPKVLLVSPFEDGFDLISRCSLVSVISGTAAWEAMLLGKPALIFGNVSFSCMDGGYVQCSDFEELPQRVEEALALSPASHDELVSYIAAVHAEGVQFNLWREKPEDVPPEMMSKLCQLLISRLKPAPCA